MKPFFYDLPAERIAQRPIDPPDAARLLLNSEAGITESTFARFADFIEPGDAIVFNNSKVIPARIFITLQGGGEGELLLLRKQGEGCWICTGRPLKKLRTGSGITCAEGLRGTVKERVAEREIRVEFSDGEGLASDARIFEAGVMPIPPYIRSGKADDKDVLDYQSIFARNEGSVAAPTASLHFTPHVIDAMRRKGARIFEVTLHVGSASFLAVWDPECPDEISPPGEEYYFYNRQLLSELHAVKNSGGKIVAIGTTVTRAIESMARQSAEHIQTRSLVATNLFITPGYEFLVVDRLVTNFHQPGTTHLLLVEAFIGSERLARTYAHALDTQYRFLSYGDGMMLAPLGA